MSNEFYVPWDDAPEEQLPSQGQHELRIIGKEVGQTSGRGGKPIRRMITVTIAVEEPGDWQPITHWLVFPNADEWDDPESVRTAKMMVRNVRRFLRLFGIDEREFTGEDAADLLDGATAVGVVQHDHQDGSGETYARLRLPRAQD